MRRPELQQLDQGSCIGLQPQVIDKYFMANPNYERFEHLTARVICGRCAVQRLCLVEAIRTPVAKSGVRGGVAAGPLHALRSRYLAGTDAEALADEVIASQRATFAERLRQLVGPEGVPWKGL